MGKSYIFRVTSEGVQELKKQLEELGPVGDVAFKKLVDASPSLANAFERAQTAVDKFKKTAADGQGGGFLKLLAEQADGLGQKASGLIGALGPVGELLSKLGPVGVTAAAGLGGLVTVMTMANKAAEEQARQFRQIDAVLKATGNQSGLTRQEIVAMAEAIEQSTMASGGAVLDAAGALATFRGIGTATFGDVLKRAQDMSVVFGGDLKANTLDIGKALQKVASGDVDGLRRSFGFLGSAALGSVEDLAKAGKAAEAQAKFMAALQSSIGGAAEAERGNTLTGAVKGLGDAWDDFLKAVGKTDGAMKKAVDAAAGGVRAITEGLKPAAPDSRFVRPQGGADAEEFDALRRQLDRGPGTAMTRQGEDAWRKALEKRIQDLSDKGRAAGGVTDAEAQAMNEREARRFAAAGQAQATAADAAAADKARADSADRIVKSLEHENELLSLGAKAREQQAAADKAEAQYREANRGASEAELAAGIARVRAAAQANVIRRQDLDLARETAKADADAAAAQDRDRAAAQKRADDIVAADAARNRRTEDYIGGLEQAAAMQGLSSTEMKVQEALLKAQNALIDEQGHKLRDLTEEEKNRVRRAVETTEEMDKQRKAAEKAQRDLDHAIQQGTDQATTKAADILFDGFTGKITGIGDYLRQTLLRAAAEATANMIFRPLIQPVMQSVIGSVPSMFGLGGGGGGGGGGLASSGGGSGFSIGNLSSLFSLGNNAGLFGDTFSLGNIGASLGLGSAAGGAGLGAAAGLLPSSEIFAGLPGVGAGVIGLSPLAMTGIGLGVAAAALILPKIFASKKSVGPNAGGVLAYTDSGFTAGNVNADNGGDTGPIRAALNQTADALNALMRTYNLGVDTTAAVGRFAGIDSGIGPYAKSSEELFMGLIRAGALTGEGSVGLALRNTRATTPEGIEQDIQFAQMIDGLAASAEAMSPVAAAVKAVADQFDEMAERASALGLALDDVNAAREREIVKAREQASAATLGNIQSAISALTMGSGSALSPEQQLFAARTAFNQAAAAADAGDAGAVSQVGSFATQYLGLSRSFFGTTEAYGRQQQDVLDRLRSIVVQQAGGTDVVAAILSAGQAQTSYLAQLLASIDNLTNAVRRNLDAPARRVA